MNGMLFAEFAVFLHFQPLRIVFLVFESIVIPLFAFRTSKSNLVSVAFCRAACVPGFSLCCLLLWQKMPFLCILSRLVRGKCGVCLLRHSVFPHFPWCRAGLPAPDEAVPGGEILFLPVKTLFISVLLLFPCDSLRSGCLSFRVRHVGSPAAFLTGLLYMILYFKVWYAMF